jgi:hypothetical protein
MADESLPCKLFCFFDLIELAYFPYYSPTVDNYEDMYYHQSPCEYSK